MPAEASLVGRPTLLALVALVLLLLSGGSLPAFACSCPPPDLARDIRDASAIFRARVVALPPLEPDGGASVVVEAFDVWKGQVPSRTVLSSTIHSNVCGVFTTRPAVGETRLVLGRSLPDGGFAVSQCSHALWPGDPPWRATLQDIAAQRRQIDGELAAAPGSLAPQLANARFRETWDPDGAAAIYAALARDHPDLAAGHLGLGRTLFGLRQPAEALPPVQRAAAMRPDDPEPAALIAHIRFRLGDARALDGIRHFRSLRLPDLDVSGRDLRQADFSGTAIGTLIGRRTDFRGVSFRAAVIGPPSLSFGPSASSLHEAQLQGADLTGLTARGIELTGADLSGARMTGATMDWTSLDFARMRGVTGQRVSFRRARLNQVVLAGARLPDADFQQAQMLGVDLRNAALTGANFDLADLRGADLTGARLAGARFFSTFYDCRTRFPRGFDPVAVGMVVPPESCAPATPPAR